MLTKKITIIVLTYNRDDILNIQSERLEALYQANPIFEVVLVDNNADGQSRHAFFEGRNFPTAIITPPTNVGVAGGRNLGINASNTNFLVFWDDDALVDSSFPIQAIPEYFQEDTKLGAIAFKSINPTTGKTDRYEFPHTNKKWINRKVPFNTFRFIGVGHAINRQIFDEVSMYDDTFFYGMEEFDLSYRLINRGYRIIYDPKFSLEHHRHTSGRLDPSEKWIKSYTNKLKLAHKNLPLRYFCSVATVWFFYTAYKTYSIKASFQSINYYREWVAKNNPTRTPISKTAISYIKKCGGNIYV